METPPTVTPLEPAARTCLEQIRSEHAALAAVLRSILLMLEHGPAEQPEKFFDLMRAMLFYIDEFPERLHHPKESDLLFPKVARRVPELLPVIGRLEREHMEGEHAVRVLQHALLAWEFTGDAARAAFEASTRVYVTQYLDHMRVEEQSILPAAQEHLTPEEWHGLAAAFASNGRPLASRPDDPRYDRLFTKIVTHAPAPIGVGPHW